MFKFMNADVFLSDLGRNVILLPIYVVSQADELDFMRKYHLWFNPKGF